MEGGREREKGQSRSEPRGQGLLLPLEGAFVQSRLTVGRAGKVEGNNHAGLGWV